MDEAEELRVVQAEPGDLETVIGLLEEVAAWLESKGINQWPVGWFRDSMAFYAEAIGRGEMYLASVGDEVVGTLRLGWEDANVWPDVADDAAYVHTLAVRRTWAGRRLGRRLLEWVEAQAASAGKNYLRLDCITSNDVLRRYYEDAGFAAAGELEVSWPLGMYPAQRYEKAVGPAGSSEAPEARRGAETRRAATAPAPREKHRFLAGLKVEWREFGAPTSDGRSAEEGGASFGLWAVVDDLATVLSQMTQADLERSDQRMPYFAIIWPSAEALLAKVLAGPPLDGLHVLDLGCGLGPTGFAAAQRGARVTFLDWDPRALEIVRASAREQSLAPETFDFVVADWRKPPHLAPFDLVLGADLLYDRRSPPAVAAFLGRHLKPGAEAWIADPGRPYAEEFSGRVEAHGVQHLDTEILAWKAPGPQISLLKFRRPRWERRGRIQSRSAGRRLLAPGQ